MEGKGKQAMWFDRKPEVLAALRELAIVQSAESSNRIEGVTVEATRLRPILVGGSRPRDRSEEEVVGYRKALDWVHGSHEHIQASPETVKRLHELAQGGFTGDAGKWKTRPNDIIELMPDGRRRVRFVAVEPDRVPAAVEQLCLGYRQTCEQDLLPPLLASAAFLLDFLCIHPFRDGNGRVCRLLMLLLLYHHGYRVGTFVSPERIIEETKESYYETLGRSSEGWHRGEHSVLPWWNYFLSVIKQAHGELEMRLELAESNVGKTELVRQIVLGQVGPFSLAEIAARCPSVSPQLVKKVLSDLKKEGRVVLRGRGRGARWRLAGD